VIARAEPDAPPARLLLDAHVWLWFRRLLLAQALADALTLVTADPAMPPYGVPYVWAGDSVTAIGLQDRATSRCAEARARGHAAG
jgi:hypothetical protein